MEGPVGSVARAVEAVHKLVEIGRMPHARRAAPPRAPAQGEVVGALAAPSMGDVRALARAAPHVELAERFARVTVGGPERGDPIVDVG